MKTLYFKNGLTQTVKTTKDFENRYISVYEDEKLLYSVYKSPSIFKSKVIFYGEISEMAFYEIGQINEIIENFDQYFNLLNQ